LRAGVTFLPLPKGEGAIDAPRITDESGGRDAAAAV
jgi:hypothetical protein